LVALKWSQHIVVLLKGSSITAAAVVHFFRGHSNVPVDPLDLTPVPHPRFFVQGHILSTIGDALKLFVAAPTTATYFSLRLDSCTSSKISSGGSHIEHWWRCFHCGNFQLLAKQTWWDLEKVVQRKGLLSGEGR
jgi:hypothetical protein